MSKSHTGSIINRVQVRYDQTWNIFHLIYDKSIEQKINPIQSRKENENGNIIFMALVSTVQVLSLHMIESDSRWSRENYLLEYLSVFLWKEGVLDHALPPKTLIMKQKKIRTVQHVKIWFINLGLSLLQSRISLCYQTNQSVCIEYKVMLRCIDITNQGVHTPNLKPLQKHHETESENKMSTKYNFQTNFRVWYLKCWVYNKYVWIYFTQIVLAKLQSDMLYYQVYCDIIISSSWDDDICIFFRWQYEFIETGLDKFSIL